MSIFALSSKVEDAPESNCNERHFPHGNNSSHFFLLRHNNVVTVLAICAMATSEREQMSGYAPEMQWKNGGRRKPVLKKMLAHRLLYGRALLIRQACI
jgi:hypothetical protein